MRRARGCPIFLLALFILVPWGRGAENEPAVQTRTLDALVGEVLAHNPELRGVEADVAASRGARIQAGLWKNPDLALMYANRQVRTADTPTGYGFSDSIGITQTFEFPGKATLRKALADKDVALAEAGLRQFRLALAGRVRLLGYRYALGEQNGEAAQVVVERSRELVELLDKRPKAGMQAVFDSGILEGNLAELTTTRRELEQEARSTRSELNLLRGRPAETPLRVELPEERPPVPKDIAALTVRSMATSPILQMKALSLQRGKMQVSASRLDVAPDFSIQPYYSLDQAADHDQKIGATLTVTLPIWNQNQGNIASARAGTLKAEATEAQARDDLQLSLAHVYETRTLIGQQLDQAGPDLLPRLARLADMADRNYRLGAINLQTFLETQRQYLATTRSIHQAILDDISADLDLQLLSGTMDLGSATGATP